MAIKAILLDIDGTLTNSKKEITPLTKEVLLKAQAKGIRLVIKRQTCKGIVPVWRSAGNALQPWCICML